MEKIFKLFIATTELYQSPLVAPLGTTCDAALTLGEERLLQIVLPDCPTDACIEISYNPDMLEVSDARVELRSGSNCLLALRTRGCELGHTFLTIFNAGKPTSTKYATDHLRIALPALA